jgi:hypothetical protein
MDAHFSMETLLPGNLSTVIPAAIASTVLFIINVCLLRYVFNFDREARKSPNQ